jgi:hypothetical protein
MTISKERQSVLAIIAGLIAITIISRNYSFLVAGGLFAASLPFPFVCAFIHKVWMFLSDILGWISRHIILTVLFYIFLTPFAFLLRLFGKQTMQVHWEKKHSFFSERNHLYTANDFKNPW